MGERGQIVDRGGACSCELRKKNNASWDGVARTCVLWRELKERMTLTPNGSLIPKKA